MKPAPEELAFDLPEPRFLIVRRSKLRATHRKARGLSSRQAQGFRPPAPHHSPQGDAEGLRAGGAGAKPNHTQIWVKLTMATNKVDGDADSTLTGCPRLDLPDLPGLELPELPQSLNPAFPDLAFQEIGAPVKS
jgi:hypothetical protein